MALEASFKCASQSNENHRYDDDGEDCVGDQDGEVERPNPSLATKVDNSAMPGPVVIKIGEQEQTGGREGGQHDGAVGGDLPASDQGASGE